MILKSQLTHSFDRVGSNGLSSQITTISETQERAGDINITTDSLFVTNGANLGASAPGIGGNSGKITLKADDSVLLNEDGRIREIDYYHAQKLIYPHQIFLSEVYLSLALHPIQFLIILQLIAANVAVLGLDQFHKHYIKSIHFLYI